jgi:ribosomal protein S18 acetylase RimI-like enzyme
MEKIRLAKSNDLPRIEKMFRRVRASMELNGVYCWSQGYPTNEDFENDIANKNAYILTDDGMVKAYMAISTNLLEAFYPDSHDEQKLIALLSDLESDGDEKGIVLERLMVDPAFRKKGYAKEIVNSLRDKFPHSLWIALVVESNAAVFPFYENMGFKQAGYHEFEYGKNSHCLVLYKRG